MHTRRRADHRDAVERVLRGEDVREDEEPSVPKVEIHETQQSRQTLREGEGVLCLSKEA
jgi:hypothetical protein